LKSEPKQIDKPETSIGRSRSEKLRDR